jgi:hypothetical protein
VPNCRYPILDRVRRPCVVFATGDASRRQQSRRYCDARFEYVAADGHGCWYDVDAAAASGPRLCGNPTEFELPAPELAGLFADADHPVVVDGEFYWSDEAAALLRPSASAT